MSWFDDPDLEAAFEGLPSEASQFSDSLEYDTPGVDDVVAGRYRVEDALSDNRAIVRHTRLNQKFLARWLPNLKLGSQDWARLEFVTDVAGLLSNDQLGFVAEFGVCPRFGGFAICENAPGVSLSQILDSAPRFDLEEALGFVVDLGGVLAELHDVGVAHGLLDGDDVVRDASGAWRLLAPGVPSARVNVGPPPGVSNALQATPASDQWALAYAVYAMLVGQAPDVKPFAPSDLRVDIPAALDVTLLKALNANPDARYDSIQAFVEAFQAAVVQWRTPLSESSAVSADSWLFGGSESDQSLAENSFARSRIAARSVIVVLEQLGTPRIALAFQNITRLRTECRRNIVAGGLFVPGVTNVLPGQVVDLVLSYDPAERELTALAKVAEVRTGEDPGCALLFDASEHARVLAFVHEVDPASDLKATDKLVALRALDQNAQISAAEAFLLSRMLGPTQLGHLRAFFNGLPFDFDETVVSLIDKGYLQVERATPPVSTSVPKRATAAPASATMRPQGRAAHTDKLFGTSTSVVAVPPARSTPSPAPEPTLQKQAAPTEPSTARPTPGLQPRFLRTNTPVHVEPSKDDIELALDKATVFETRGNFRAAMEVLQNMLSAKKDARLYHRLGVMRARFQGAYGKAGRELEKALALKPGDPEILASQRWLEALVETEAVQHVFKHGFGDAQVRMLRQDPDIRRAWVCVDVTPTDKRILGIDYVRNRVVTTVRSSDRNAVAISGNHPRLAGLEARLPANANTLRMRRQKLAEMARTSDDYGPWFRVGPVPAAVSPSSNFLVFDGHPTDRTPGLYIVQELTTMSPLRLEREGTRGVHPVIAPDNSGAVAFATHGPIQAIWVAEQFQAAKELTQVSGDALVEWGNAMTLFGLELRTGRIFKVGRKGGDVSEICKVGGCRTWVCDPEVDSAVVVHNGDRKLTRVGFKDGTQTTLELAEPAQSVLLRGDGVAAALTASGLTFLDFGHKRIRTLHVRVHPSSFHDNTWLPKQPLLVMLDTADGIELASIDPGVLL